MKTNALLINSKDNVVTVTERLDSGKEVIYSDGGEYVHIITSGVPAYHKIARCDITEGELVVKYGQIMAVATCCIKKGEHVHTQNVESKI